MIYSYIGSSGQLASFDNMLKKKIEADKRQKNSFVSILEPGGVYSGNAGASASLAGEMDMCAYLSMRDAIEKSDIIFMFLSDGDLEKMSSYLARFKVRDKIFCHFSPAYSADVLDFSSDNTYVSMYIPYFERDNEDKSYPEYLIAYGYGRRLKKFKDLLSELGINCCFVSSEEKLLCLTAVNMAREMPTALTSTAQKLIKYSLASSPVLSESIRSIMDENPKRLSGYDAIEADNKDFALTQCKLLSDLGLADITKMYISLLRVYIDSYEPTENRKRIMRYTMENL